MVRKRKVKLALENNFHNRFNNSSLPPRYKIFKLINQDCVILICSIPSNASSVFFHPSSLKNELKKGDL